MEKGLGNFILNSLKISEVVNDNHVVTFESPDAKIMPKRLTKIRHYDIPNMPKPKQLWSLMMSDFGSQDAQIMPKILQSRQYEGQNMSKLEISYPS